MPIWCWSKITDRSDGEGVSKDNVVARLVAGAQLIDLSAAFELLAPLRARAREIDGARLILARDLKVGAATGLAVSTWHDMD
jgi:hypothetical protein